MFRTYEPHELIVHPYNMLAVGLDWDIDYKEYNPHDGPQVIRDNLIFRLIDTGDKITDAPISALVTEDDRFPHSATQRNFEGLPFRETIDDPQGEEVEFLGFGYLESFTFDITGKKTNRLPQTRFAVLDDGRVFIKEGYKKQNWDAPEVIYYCLGIMGDEIKHGMTMAQMAFRTDRFVQSYCDAVGIETPNLGGEPETTQGVSETQYTP